jgi:hypothetical protein
MRLCRREKIYLAAELTGTCIPVRAGSIGAEREGSKAAIDEVGFGRRQLTGAATDQDSVLVIHMFLLSSFGPLKGAKALQHIQRTGPHFQAIFCVTLRRALTASFERMLISIRAGIVGA